MKTLTDHGHVNQFEDVHAKIRAFKERLLAVNEKDEHDRQSRLAKDAEDTLGDQRKPVPPSSTES